MTQAMIETKQLTKCYHAKPVVDHLDISVPEGAIYGFLGPNGAGKSTTMKMLLGLISRDPRNDCHRRKRNERHEPDFHFKAGGITD